MGIHRRRAYYKYGMTPTPGSASRPSLWYVIFGGAREVPLWPKDRDRFVFLSGLRRWLAQAHAVCEGFYLADQDARLMLVSAAPPDLDTALESVCRAYTRYWREWYRPQRHVFRPPRAVPEPDPIRWDALASIEVSPVLAGLCPDPWRYRWSSAGAHSGLGPSYLPLAMDAWRETWTCAGWRQRLDAWRSDWGARKRIDALLRRLLPFKSLAAPVPVPAAEPPLFRARAEAARAAAGF